MKAKLLAALGVFLAVALHVGILLFGGAIFSLFGHKEKKVQQVDLIATEELNSDAEKKEETVKPKEEEIKEPEEAPPESADVIAQSAAPSADSTPVLEAASLSAIEAALGGGGGDAGFGGAVSFASGGRIGGTGRPGAAGGGGKGNETDAAFSMADIDQKPRAIFQVAPSYPSELRARKAQGEVWLVFVVDARGRVSSVRVEKASHPAFGKPAMDAVKQWKFEPATRGGQKVSCRMRLPVKFSVG